MNSKIMKRYSPMLVFLLTLAVFAASLSGCRRRMSSEDEKQVELGDLMNVVGVDPETKEPIRRSFTPPETLEEVDARAGEWIDRPVRDSLHLLKEHLEKQEPLATVEEALQMKNDSEEDNEKILSALGRQPESPEEVDWDAEIIRHSAGDVNSLNPLLASSVADFDITGMTAFGLFSFDWNFNPFAMKEVVESWQSSEDRMIDKIVLRDDLVWSDGEPITAHDVEFSFKVIMTEAVPVPAMRSGTDKIRYVKAYDDRTIVYFHEDALATNIWNLNFSVIPKHVYEDSVLDDPTLVNSDYHVELENAPVVGGPYQVVSRKRGQEIVLKAREDWYMHDGEQVRDRPYFETVRFKIVKENAVALMSLKSGDLDEMILTPVQWRTQTNDEDFYRNNTKAYGVEWVYFYFGWNLETPFFKDKRVRRAMSYAFDHEEMLKTLRYGMDEPAVGIFHPDSKWAPEDPPEPFTQDLDKAKALLKEAGWEDHDDDGILDKQIGGKTVPFEFTLLCPSLGDRVKYGELLQQSLDKIGIRCRVQPLEFTVLQQKTHDHQFQAYFGGWGTGADPDTSDNIWGTDENRNYVGYSNPEVDRLFEEGRREFDPEKRRKIYAKIHKILYEDQPYTWLYVRNAYYAFNKDLRGYYFSPRGPYHYGPGFGAIWKPKAAP